MASLKSIIRQGKQTRSDLKQLRNSGKVPAVVYGYGTKNTSVKVDEVEFIKVIREVGRNGVIDLGVGSKTIKVMVSDYQFDPLKNQITHIDFLAINMSERTVEVPVHLVGEAVGAKEGGVVEQPLFDLEVTATPENILNQSKWISVSYKSTIASLLLTLKFLVTSLSKMTQKTLS